MLFPVVVSPDYIGAGEGEGLGMFGWLVGKSSLRGQPRSPVASLSFPGVFSVSQSPSPIRCRFPASLGAVVLMVEVTITSCSS